MAPPTVNHDDEEADEGQHVGDIHGGMAEDGLLVDDHALKWRHERSADNRHDEEGGTERSVLTINVFEGDAVNCREHQRHEETDADEAIQTEHSDDGNGSERTHGGSNCKDRQQHARIHIAHEEGRDEAAAQKQRHGDDVVHLRRGLVDAEVVGVLDDEGPRHNLGGDIEHLRDDTLAINAVFPQVRERLARRMDVAEGFLLLALRLRHLRQSNDDENTDDNKSDRHVWIANHSQIVHANRCFFGFRERSEDDLSGCVATVANELRKHDERGHRHARQRPHRIEGLREVQSARRGLFRTKRQDERIGGRFEKSESEGQDVERQAEEHETLLRGCRNEQECADGVECQTEQNAFFITEFSDEQGRRNRHRSVAAVEGELHHRRLGRRQFHHGLKRCHHRVCDVIGEAPEGEQRGDENEGDEIFFLN